MRLMDLPGLLCYPARVTCGFMLSEGGCTYITCFRETVASVHWVLNESCGRVTSVEGGKKEGHIMKKKNWTGCSHKNCHI